MRSPLAINAHKSAVTVPAHYRWCEIFGAGVQAADQQEQPLPGGEPGLK
jgi:hypothetical protein